MPVSCCSLWRCLMDCTTTLIPSSSSPPSSTTTPPPTTLFFFFFLPFYRVSCKGLSKQQQPTNNNFGFIWFRADDFLLGRLLSDGHFGASTQRPNSLAEHPALPAAGTGTPMARQVSLRALRQEKDEATTTGARPCVVLVGW